MDPPAAETKCLVLLRRNIGGMRKMVRWGFGASVRVEIILRGADRSVLARNIESVALRPCQVAREAEI